MSATMVPKGLDVHTAQQTQMHVHRATMREEGCGTMTTEILCKNEKTPGERRQKQGKYKSDSESTVQPYRMQQTGSLPQCPR